MRFAAFIAFSAALLSALPEGWCTTVPGAIQAEDYDVGGEGVGYHDSTAGNVGNVYRSDDVDIETNDVGGYHVSYITPGEWLRFSISVTSAIRARVQYRVSSGAAGSFSWRLSLDDRTVDVQNGYPTGGWWTYAYATSPLAFHLPDGVHTLRVDFIEGEFNLDALVVAEETNVPPAYLDPEQPVSNRVADLLSRMSLAEKRGQLCLPGMEFFYSSWWGPNDQRDIELLGLGGVLNGAGAPVPVNTAAAWADRTDRYQGYALATRLHIPIIYGVDAVHGHGNVYGATLFPHNIGLGATRDPRHAERAAQVTAVELRATGMHWAYAPAVTVARDERWGRFYEAFGELPELSAEMGEAAIRGYQGSDLSSPTSVLACAKHFAGDGGTVWGTGRDGKIDQGDAILDEVTFRALHLAPYSNAVNAGVATVMASYSSWNGVRMHSHTGLLTGVLKGEMGFDGFVVSDWGGVFMIDPGNNEGLETMTAINAGIDMVMVPDNYRGFLGHLEYAVSNGNITVTRLDDAVRRILTAKFKLGLFDRPFADRSLLARFGSAEHRAAARAAVRDSLVVLKNDGDLLPLPKDLARIHVAGKNADNLGYQCGGWTISWQGGSGDTTVGTTIYEAITQSVAGACQVTFSADGSGATGATVGIVVVGETPYAEFFGDSASISLSTQDVAALQNVKAAGLPTVLVLVTGRPLDLTPHLSNCDAVVVAWLPGTEGGGVADVLFGDHYPSGRLPQTWPRSLAQVPINMGDAAYDPLFPWDDRQGLEPRVSFGGGPGEWLAAWKDGATGFTLQSSTNLAGQVAWTNVPGAPVRTDGTFRVTLPAVDDASFYRLHRPPQN